MKTVFVIIGRGDQQRSIKDKLASFLKMLEKKNTNVEVIIITSNKSNISKLDIQKFNKEYPVL